MTPADNRTLIETLFNGVMCAVVLLALVALHGRRAGAVLDVLVQGEESW